MRSRAHLRALVRSRGKSPGGSPGVNPPEAPEFLVIETARESIFDNEFKSKIDIYKGTSNTF